MFSGTHICSLWAVLKEDKNQLVIVSSSPSSKLAHGLVLLHKMRMYWSKVLVIAVSLSCMQPCVPALQGCPSPRRLFVYQWLHSLCQVLPQSCKILARSTVLLLLTKDTCLILLSRRESLSMTCRFKSRSVTHWLTMRSMKRSLTFFRTFQIIFLDLTYLMSLPKLMQPCPMLTTSRPKCTMST